jgi:predicted GIY-YIG superfamily endonuclease
MSHQNYFVYILTNADHHTVLYLGVTNVRRLGGSR